MLLRTPGGTRTRAPPLRRRALCPAELPALAPPPEGGDLIGQAAPPLTAGEPPAALARRNAVEGLIEKPQQDLHPARLVSPLGLEPRIRALKVRCSDLVLERHGSEDGIRTRDRPVMSRLLCQTELPRVV